MVLLKTDHIVSKPTFKHIEAELYKYQETVKEIKKLRYTIIETSTVDENVGGGRSNIPSRPTEILATRLTTHKQLDYLESIAYSIETVYNLAPDSHRRLIQLRYWSNKDFNWDEIAVELFCSRRKALNMRKEIVLATAEILGWR